MDLLTTHPTIIDKIPADENKKSSKSNKKYSTLKDAAKQNLKTNKQQFEIDRQMMTALPREMRLEKELRRPCGTQYGISVERIRGTVQYPDYSARIPQVLVKLKNLLEARGGFNTVGIFRIQPDAKEFPIVKEALNTNNFEFRINDINCVANAIKVWFRELPIKVLNPISKEKVFKCSSQDEVAEIISSIAEPYKSLFEWLLDLAVQVVDNVNKNKMDAKNMAVVLCPNLYENNDQANDAMSFQSALLRFTELAIRQRIQYRKNNPVQEINDMLAIQAGLTPGIADQNALQLQNRNVPIIQADDDDEDDLDDNKELLSGEEGDGFAGALYSGSRFRGASLAQPGNEYNKIGISSARKNPLMGDVDEHKGMDFDKPPPPAYSDYEDDDIAPEEQEEEHFADIAPDANPNHAKKLSVAIEAGKVKNVAAKLAIDPKAMLPGAKGPSTYRRRQPSSPRSPVEIKSNASLSKPVQPKKKKKAKKKKLLLESMVDNYAEASGAKVPDPPKHKPEPERQSEAQSEEEEQPRRQSHHVPMES